MTWNELDRVLKQIENNNKTTAENTRSIMYSVFQSQSTKSLKPQDIIKFSWEEEDTIKPSIQLYNKDEAIDLINKLNKK